MIRRPPRRSSASRPQRRLTGSRRFLASATACATVGALVVTACAPVPPSTNSDGSIPQAHPLGTNGITRDGTTLILADIVGGQLLRFRESTGEITQRIGLADGLKRPDDLVVTPDGSMVYTSPLDGIVGRARPGSRPEILAHLNTPNPIVLEPSGNSVLVAETLLTTSRVLRVPLNGGTTQVVVNGLPPLNSFDLGTDGALYAPSGGIPTAATGTGGVVKLDPATGDYQQLVLKNPDGTSFKGFAMPVAAKFGQDGTLYVLQGINAAVFQVNVTTGVTSRLARLLSPSGDNLAVFSDHLVATGFDNHLTRINFDGTTSLVRVGR